MHNVTHTIHEGKLLIQVDLSSTSLAGAPASASGKTKLVASTSGSIALPPVEGRPVSFSLNVMVKG